jgi:predicted RNase H-like HicB family nuclease
MRLLVTIEPDETGMLVVECPAILGCISQGQTEAEALEKAGTPVSDVSENALA